jgi:hypothetical protein
MVDLNDARTLHAIVWRLIKRQGGTAVFDTLPPPQGFSIEQRESTAGSRYVLLEAKGPED